MKLGLVTIAPQPRGALAVDDEQLEDWDDLKDDVKDCSDESSDDDYTFDTERRSSVDLDNMSINSHDQKWDNGEGGVAGCSSFHGDTHDPNKRLRSRKPMVASISEETTVVDDEEIATVDGDNDEDMEFHDAELV